MSILVSIIILCLHASAWLPQDVKLTEKEKIEALIAHVAGLQGATFIRNGDEHSPEDAADHMRTKWDYAGSRVRTAAQFIDEIASKSSMSGEPYLIRFSDGREVKSGAYLKEVLQSIENPATDAPDPPAQESEAAPIGASQSAEHSMKNFDHFMGAWVGTIEGKGPDGTATTIAINWTTTKVFDGRWIRFEFTSKEPGPAGRHLEWEGLFTANETGEVETVWMTPRLRAFAGDSRFLDGRMIFFEKGRWDEAGRVLTLIAHKQYGPEEPMLEVKSTFTIAENGESFTVVDEEKQSDGSWETSGRFTLARAEGGP